MRFDPPTFSLVRDRPAVKAYRRSSPVTCSEEAAALVEELADAPTEHFVVLLLDARGCCIGTVTVGQGTLTACLVHPREVFAPAIVGHAASIIAVHNHPSGDTVPSEEDHRITERLAEAGRILGIPLQDHIIIARDGNGAFRSRSIIGGA